MTYQTKRSSSSWVLKARIVTDDMRRSQRQLLNTMNVRLKRKPKVI